MSKMGDIAVEAAGETARTEAYSASQSVAWPLVGLFFTLWAGLGLVTWAALSGVLPYWAGTLGNFALFYVLSHINHEATHRNISGARAEAKPLNDAIGHVGSFLFFLPFPAFRAVHLAHHRLTNHPELDGDMWFARRSAGGVLHSGVTLLFGYEVTLQRLYRLGFVKRGDMIAIYGQRLAAMLLFVVLAALGFAYEAFMLWILPALMVMLALAFLAFAVHYPHDSRKTYQATNVWLAPRFLQPLVTAAFVFQNYHLVHHLKPRIPFYRYGEAFRQMRAELEQNKAAIRHL